MVAIQDFEDLVLRHFRQLALVKCIGRKQCSNFIEVVVMNRVNSLDLMNLRNSPTCSLPRVSITDLKVIGSAILPLASPFFQFDIKIKMTNPVYIKIGFEVTATFNGYATPAENQLRLYEDLQEFVNPWFSQEDQIPKFGHWFSYGEVVACLQGKAYVNAIYEVTLVVLHETGNQVDCQFEENEMMVLISPDAVKLNENPDDEELGISTMTIGRDFYVFARD